MANLLTSQSFNTHSYAHSKACNKRQQHRAKLRFAQDSQQVARRCSGRYKATQKLHLEYNYIVVMNHLTFEWDEKKDASNQKKHGVSFNEAKSVFTDQFARLIADPQF